MSTAVVTVSGRVAADVGAGIFTLASLIQLLPPMAALVGMVYYMLLISDNPKFLKFIRWLGSFRVSFKVPSSLRLQFVEDWREGKRWLSVQFMTAAIALEGTLTFFPAMLTPYIPPNVMQALVMFCLAAAFIGRFLKQKGKGNDQGPSQ